MILSERGYSWKISACCIYDSLGQHGSSCLECGNNGVNTCEWAIQDRLVHCHHTGEPHNHPPHPKPQSKCKGGNYLRNPAQAVRVFISRFILDCSFSSIEAAALSAGARVCVIYHACHKQVRSSLFIWEGSESRKPSCRSSCCCLRSLHLNLLGIFVR